MELDAMDLKILELLQADATMPIAEIGKIVGLSTTPCWRRIQKLDEAGVIRARVAVLDPVQVNTGVTVFVSIKTDQHNLDWLERFHAAVVDCALDDLVTEQRKQSPAQEQRTRVAVPVDARCAALIVDRFLSLRAKLADFTKLQRVVSQEEDRRRRFEEMLITRASGNTDWQTECSGVVAVRFVEETVTSQFAL